MYEMGVPIGSDSKASHMLMKLLRRKFSEDQELNNPERVQLEEHVKYRVTSWKEVVPSAEEKPSLEEDDDYEFGFDSFLVAPHI
ncbi:hypothetical protein L1987_78327 [Smallanthus sonchifolius]|uniref:Uncharacterized protein n=1 Tax=Smallanthus sonchifolius TaxID=185202 RepID=A0ACB8ZBF8_9ASTR|nr:hypothetical protein L1987_78327 [Smallanthus sonchifolius]